MNSEELQRILDLIQRLENQAAEASLLIEMVKDLLGQEEINFKLINELLDKATAKLRGEP